MRAGMLGWLPVLDYGMLRAGSVESVRYVVACVPSDDCAADFPGVLATVPLDLAVWQPVVVTV